MSETEEKKREEEGQCPNRPLHPRQWTRDSYKSRSFIDVGAMIHRGEEFKSIEIDMKIRKCPVLVSDRGLIDMHSCSLSSSPSSPSPVRRQNDEAASEQSAE